MGAVEQKIGNQLGQVDEIGFQRFFGEMRPRLDGMVQQIISSHVERIESRVKGLEKSTHIMEQAVADLSNDLERIIVDRAVKEAKAEASKEIKNRLGCLEASLRASDSLGLQQERHSSSDDEGICQQL